MRMGNLLFTLKGGVTGRSHFFLESDTLGSQTSVEIMTPTPFPSVSPAVSLQTSAEKMTLTPFPATTDLCDAHHDLQICAPVFRDFGGHTAFHGRIATLKVFEDNALVRSTLESPGADRVLVVDGGGSLRCALVGGMLGELAVKNRWAGIVVNGCVRDFGELAALPLGVRALAAHPRKSFKGLHGGAADVPVEFAGVRFAPGAWLYADADGIVVSANAVHG
jgi:regulator of ribonuclease activity A